MIKEKGHCIKVGADLGFLNSKIELILLRVVEKMKRHMDRYHQKCKRLHVVNAYHVGTPV